MLSDHGLGYAARNVPTYVIRCDKPLELRGIKVEETNPKFRDSSTPHLNVLSIGIQTGRVLALEYSSSAQTGWIRYWCSSQNIEINLGLANASSSDAREFRELYSRCFFMSMGYISRLCITKSSYIWYEKKHSSPYFSVPGDCCEANYTHFSFWSSDRSRTSYFIIEYLMEYILELWLRLAARQWWIRLFATHSSYFLSYSVISLWVEDSESSPTFTHWKHIKKKHY